MPANPFAENRGTRRFGLLCLQIIALLLTLTTAARAEPPDRTCSNGAFGPVQCIRQAHFVHDLCQLIDITTGHHSLDTGFFARLIWQESRFDPNALSHANARGIAQFIPSTAALRGLRNPYNPADALTHSAQYLAELAQRFGNIGMAAVAYNGGENRATGFIAQTGGLASETIEYVQIITGLSAETWRDTPPAALDLRLSKTTAFMPACIQLAQGRRLSPLPRPPRQTKPWGVQLAFGSTKSQARQRFAQRTARCAATIKGETPEFVQVKNRVSGRKGYIMARLGRTSRDSADALCARLRQSGCPCAVYKNPS